MPFSFVIKLFVSIMYIITLVALVIATAAILHGCPAPRPISPVPPVITDSDQCDEACGRLQELGCADGQPVATGVECVADHDCRAGDQCVNRICHSSCDTFCRDVQGWGVWLDPTCVKAVTSCEQVNSCPLLSH